MEYIHKHDIVHGDLHGVRLARFCRVDDSHELLTQSNVLVNIEGRAAVTDFGWTIIDDITTSMQSSSSEIASATRWIAPELLCSDVEMSRKTRAGDVFSFGRLCLAVRLPFVIILILCHSTGTQDMYHP
jgi:serine/threonine protein kinase